MSLGSSVVKNPPANIGDVGLIPGPGRFPGGGNDNPPSILAWKIPWTEEPGGLVSMGSQRVRAHMTEPRCTRNVVNVFVGGGYGNPEKGHFSRV